MATRQSTSADARTMCQKENQIIAVQGPREVMKLRRRCWPVPVLLLQMAIFFPFLFFSSPLDKLSSFTALLILTLSSSRANRPRYLEQVSVSWYRPVLALLVSCLFPLFIFACPAPGKVSPVISVVPMPSTALLATGV